MQPISPRLLFPSEHFGVKLCGFTHLGSALDAAIDGGATALGFNFWPKSKRYLPLADALPWLPSLRGRANRVAVLVNHTAEEIEALWLSGAVDTLQFHGNEPDDFLAHFSSRGIPCIRAMSVRSLADFARIRSCPVHAILLDAYDPVAHGGTGQTCDWELAKTAVKEFPEHRIILSGGLHPGNVAQAISQVRPAGVDVASGVESAPGVKDATLIKAFLEATGKMTQLKA